MISVQPRKDTKSAFRVLAFGAHSDDLEIGCGATLMKLCLNRRELEVRWCVFSALGERSTEARRSAEAILGLAASHRIDTFDYKDGYFPSNLSAIKDQFERIKTEFVPDVVFTHHLEDRHQDHRVISELTWNTFRNHLILEYEIPKYDGKLGDPNVFVPLDKSLCDAKVAHLMRYFPSQHGRRWFHPELFVGLMRLRGLEGGAADGYAEAFHGRKVTLDWPVQTDAPA